MGERELYDGHTSACNCVRPYRGRYVANKRRICTCGFAGMTRKKAFDQAVKELGGMTADNHAAIVRRIKELESGKD